jgi:hypothetical protein
METAVEAAQDDAWGRSISFHQNHPRLRTRHRILHSQARPHRGQTRLRTRRVFSHPGNASVFEKGLFLYPLAYALPFSSFLLNTNKNV